MTLSLYLEILTLNLPSMFFPLASLATVGKNIAFVLWTSSSARDHLRLALRDNQADLTGKAVAQFTTTSLAGMLAGNILTQFIDVGSVTQILPVFMFFSSISLTCAYRIAFLTVLREIHLNNQRANMLFDVYLAENGRVASVEEINNNEKFFLPAVLNPHLCRCIQFGKFNLTEVLAADKSYHTIMQQLC